MKYILEGNPKEVAKVIQENRIRVERGQISFALVPDEEEADNATDRKDVVDIDDTKDVDTDDTKDVDTDDTRDVVLDDTKAAQTKTAKRTKKSE